MEQPVFSRHHPKDHLNLAECDMNMIHREDLYLRRVLCVSSAPFTRCQNQPICEVTPLVLQNIDDFTLQVRGQTFHKDFFGPLIFQMPPIGSFVICNFSCQNAERRLIESCFSLPAVFLDGFCFFPGFVWVY